MVTDSHFLLSTSLYTYSPAPFITFHPFWLQNGLEISVVTLIVGYILYIANPPQTPVLPFVFLLTIYILSSFLVQIPPLTQLYGPRPFALVFTLTLPFQILSSIFKIFLVLTLLHFLIWFFFPSYLLLCFAFSYFLVSSIQE